MDAHEALMEAMDPEGPISIEQARAEADSLKAAAKEAERQERVGAEAERLSVIEEARQVAEQRKEEAALSGKLSPDAETYYELAIKGQVKEAADLRPVQRVPVVQGLLEHNTVNWIAAGSGTFKSFVSADLAFRYGDEDMDYYGKKMTHGRSLIVLAEGASGYAYRKEAWEIQYGRTVKNSTFLEHAVQLGRPHEVAALMYYLRLEEEAGRKIGMVIIDTQAMSTVGVDENTSEMNTIIQQLNRIREVSGACVIVVHHFGKDKRSGMRGSSMLYAAADTIIVTKRDEIQKGQPPSMKVTLSTSPGDLGKQKDLQAQSDFLTLEMKVHLLGEDYFGDRISSLVPVPGEPDTGSDAAVADDTPVQFPSITDIQLFYLRGIGQYESDGAGMTHLYARLTDPGHESPPPGHKVIRTSPGNQMVDLKKKGLVQKHPSEKGKWVITPLGVSMIAKAMTDAERTAQKWVERPSKRSSAKSSAEGSMNSPLALG